MNQQRSVFRVLLCISVLATVLGGCAYQREMSKLENERAVLQDRLIEENKERGLMEQTSRQLTVERDALKREIAADRRRLGQLQARKRQVLARAYQGNTKDDEMLRRLQAKISRTEHDIEEKQSRYKTLTGTF